MARSVLLVALSLLAASPLSARAEASFSGRPLVSGGTGALAGAAGADVLARTDGRSPGALLLHDARTGALVRSIQAGTTEVLALALTPDGKLVVAVTAAELQLFEAASGKRRFRTAVAGGTSVVFSPDGLHLALAAGDGKLLVLEAARGKQLRAIATGGSPRAPVFSPDGKLLAFGDGKLARTVEVATGKAHRSYSGNLKTLHSVAFSPDGKLLATTSYDGSVRLFETHALGRALGAYGGGEVADPSQPVGAKQTLTGGDALRDRSFDRARRSFGQGGGGSGAIHLCSLFLSARELVTGGNDGLVYLFDVEQGEQKAMLAGHEGVVRHLAPTAGGFLSAVQGSHVHRWEKGFAVAMPVLPGTAPAATAPQPAPAALASKPGPDAPRIVIRTGGHRAQIRALAVTPDGTRLLSASQDKTVRLWDTATGELVDELLGELGDGPVGALNALAISPDGKLVAVGGYLGTTPESVGRIRLYDLPSRRLLGLLPGHRDAVAALAFAPDSRRLLSAGADGSLRLWDATDRKLLRSFRGHKEQIAALALHGGRFATASLDRTVALWELERETPLATEELGKPVRGVAFTPDGRTLAAGADDRTISTFDVSGGALRRTERFLSGSGEIPRDESFALLGPKDASVPGALTYTRDGKQLVAGTAGGSALCHVFERSGTGHRLAGSYPGHDALVSATASGPDGTVYTAGGTEHRIAAWSPSTPAAPARFVTRGRGAIPVSVGLDGTRIAYSLAGEASTLFPHPTRIFDLVGRDFARTESLSAFPAPIHDDRTHALATVQGGPWGKKNGVLQVKRGNQVVALIEAGVSAGHTAYTLTPDGKVVSGGLGLTAHDLSGKPVSQLVGHDDQITALAISRDGKRLVSAGADQTIRLWELSELGQPTVFPLASLFIGDDDEWVLWTRDGHHTSSPRGARYVGFHVNRGEGQEARFYPFEQLDLVRNRPDRVLATLGVREPALLGAYERAWRQRVLRLGLDPDGLGTELAPPTLALASRGGEHPGATFSLSLTAKDAVGLSRLQVLVDGVPLLGSAGEKLSGKELRRTIEIPLGHGRTRLQAFVTNEKGVASSRETIHVTRPGVSPKARVFFLAVGVGDYLDPGIDDLRFPASDVTRVAALFEQGKGRFAGVEVAKLLDHGGTKERIREARAFLNRAGPQDLVVVFLAGHGTVDEAGTYWFGTADFDPGAPAAKGLSFEELDGLLDGLASRRKLLLLDTCHSGEASAEEAAGVAGSVPKTVAVRTPRLFKVKQKELPAPPLVAGKRMTELLGDLFAELRRGSGTQVISAAGGVEAAWEDPAWAGGAFTYAVTEGLGGQADADRDGTVRFSELRDFVGRRVPELTGGLQHPTSRRENVERDLQIF